MDQWVLMERSYTMNLLIRPESADNVDANRAKSTKAQIPYLLVNTAVKAFLWFLCKKRLLGLLMIVYL